MSHGAASGLSPLRDPKALDATHDPVGLWVFDGSLLDRSPTFDDLTVDNGSIQWAAGNEPGKLAVRLKDNQVRLMGTVPTPAPLLITGDVTVQIVFMMDTSVGIDSFGTALFFGPATQGGTGGEVNNDLYALQLNNSTNELVPRFTWEYGAGLRESVLAVGRSLTVGQWYHLVGVRESEGGGNCTGRIYLNGQLIQEDTGLNEASGGSGGANRIWIGRDPNNAGLGWLGGSMSSAKVNDRALTSLEVLYEYQRLSGERSIPTVEGVVPTPVAHWKLDGSVVDSEIGYDFQNDVGAGPPAYTAGYLAGTQALDTTSAARGIERTTSDAGLRLAGVAMTCEMLFNRQAASGNTEILATFNGTGELETGNYTWCIGLTAGTGGFDVGSYLSYIAESGAGVNTGLSNSAVSASEITVGSGWKHVAFTRDAAGYVKLFINGVKVLEGGTTVSTGGTLAYMRIADTGGSNYAEGWFQEVKVYDSELSETRIAERAAELGF